MFIIMISNRIIITTIISISDKHQHLDAILRLTLQAGVQGV